MIKEIYGRKIGMTQIFTPEGEMIGVTLVEIEPICLLEKVDYPTKTVAKIGFFRVDEKRINKVSKPCLGYFTKLKVSPYKFVREVAIEKETDFSFLAKSLPLPSSQAKDDQAAPLVGQEDINNKREVGIEIFKEGDIVDVQANNKGRGFAGGMKRHNWRGQPGSHGATSHRRIGSAGSNTDPGRVLKGHRMPGHMGNAKCTVKNLKVVKIDREKKLLFVKGSVPGHNQTIVKVKKVCGK